MGTGFAADKHSQLAGLGALFSISEDCPANGQQVPAASISDQRDLTLVGAAPQVSPELQLDASKTADAFQSALNSFGPRRSQKLHDRLSRWKPQFWPMVLTCLIMLPAFARFSESYGGPLSWPLTILWTWPIVNTFVGIKGVRETRKLLRASRERWVGDDPVICKDFLLVVLPTIGRHDTYPALERSVLSFVRHLPRCFPAMRVDILIEEGCEAEGRIAMLGARSPLIRVVAIPRRYRTPNGTKFKARANHFSHELRIYEGEDRGDIWVLHMDDDTGVGPDTAVAMARFIEEQYQAGPGAAHLAQGILTYPRELAVNRLMWLADSIRPADDIGRFSACTGSGVPRAGLHGELLLVRASVEARIGWDFGPRSIVEDAHFALVFGDLYPGRSAWFAGRCYGASPATVGDFIRQRERWCWGLIGLIFNKTLPVRSRCYIGYSMFTWILGPLQHVVTVLLVSALLSNFNTAPESGLIIPLWSLNISYTLWAYWEGLRLNAGVSERGYRRWWEPPVMILFMPFFAALEAVSGLRGFVKFVRRTENKFVVIVKPT